MFRTWRQKLPQQFFVQPPLLKRGTSVRVFAALLGNCSGAAIRTGGLAARCSAHGRALILVGLQEPLLPKDVAPTALEVPREARQGLRISLRPQAPRRQLLPLPFCRTVVPTCLQGPRLGPPV